MPNRRYNKQVANQMKAGGRVKKMGGGMSTARKDMRSGYYKNDMGMKGGKMYKEGGKVGKKKQGYKARKDESIAMRIKKKRTAKQLKASRDESYGKFGSKAKKSGKINRQFMNTKRMNRLEELGRVDAEKAFTKKGARNLKDEKKRIVRELKATGGKVKQDPKRKPRPKAPRDQQRKRRMDERSKPKGIRVIEVG